VRSVQRDRAEPAGSPPFIARSLTLLLSLSLSFFLSFCLVGAASYYYTSGAEKAQFRVAFQDSGNKAMDGVDKALHRSFAALDTFSTHLVAHARETQQKWPLVLFPHFAVR
jgi:hypothetical protein